MVINSGNKTNVTKIFGTILFLAYILILLAVGVVFTDQILLNLSQIFLITLGINQTLEFNETLSASAIKNNWRNINAYR